MDYMTLKHAEITLQLSLVHKFYGLFARQKFYIHDDGEHSFFG
jgi:hypothetical protein